MALPGYPRRVLRASLLELLWMMAGILLVHREIWQLHVFDVPIEHWQEGLLLPLAAIDGGITGSYSTRTRNVEHQAAYRNWLKFGAPVFFILYVACGALCERLHVGMFTVLPDVWRWLGLVLVFAGVSFRLWSQMYSPSELARASAEPPLNAVVEETPVEEPATSTTVPELVEKISAAAATGAGSAPAGEPKLPANFPTGPHKMIRYPDAAGRLAALCGIPLCFGAWIPLLAIPGIFILLKWHISDQEAFRISQLGEPYLEYRRHTWNIIPRVY